MLNRNQEKWIYAYNITMVICTLCCCLVASLIVTKFATEENPGSDFSKKPQSEKDNIFYKTAGGLTLFFMFFFGAIFNAISRCFLDVVRDYSINLDKTID